MSFTDEVANEINELQDQEAKLIAEMAPILEKLDDIKAQIAHLEGYLGLKIQKEHIFGELVEKKEPIIDKMIRVFEREKRPLHYMELMELLEKQEGLLMPGKDPKANLTAKLSGSKRFKRTERGVYILSEWEERMEPHKLQENRR